MHNQTHIAIYSGEIPSTTFIERLIKGLSNEEYKILLFGIKKHKTRYSQWVSVIGYKSNRLSKAFHFFKYSFLLLIFKNKEKRILDCLLKSQYRNTRNNKLKMYPVLYHKPDIFHIQWAKSIEDWIWVKDFGIKLVLSLRGAHINYSPIADKSLANTYKKWFPEVSGFHAVSLAIAEESTKYNVNFDHIKVIKSGLKLNDFTFELKAYDSKRSLKIISVGRDHWKKNYKLALDALFELKKFGKSFHYTIIGVKNNEALIYQRSQLGLDDDVSFIDSLPFKDVQSAIQKADLMLLPSVEEGIANVVLEAMALGTLVLSTNCGGMAEVVFHAETGFLVANRDMQSMFKALIEVSQLSLNDYLMITNQARTFVEKNHNEDNMVVEMQSLYQNL
jgi:colanic acid/amylovoran biosynthesis glycosyltransferase